MKFAVYSRWDGTQNEWALDAERALDALSELMMHGLSAREALQYMQEFGFELEGQDFRVMGARELMKELQKQMREQLERYDMSHATDEVADKLKQLLDMEERTVRERHGFESQKLNDFMERRHMETRSLAERIERFADYSFLDEAAAALYEELKREIDELKALEQFLKQYKDYFRGQDHADYETAKRVRAQLQAAEQMLKALSEGKFDQIDPEQLGQMLGQGATRSMIMLRDLESRLRESGYLRERDGSDELTPAAVRRIGAQALAQVYSSLRRGRQGGHQVSSAGAATPRPDETRPYQFGDALDLDVVKTVRNSLSRQARLQLRPGHKGKGIQLSVEDLEVREKDFATESTTVLLLDLSWSMSFEGRFPAAKRVALAMHQLIRTQFPRDKFFVVGFSTRARELQLEDLVKVSWDPGDPFTNLQDGLMVAERLIVKHPSSSPQILVITDGQPTAYFVGDELHVEWPSGYGGISPRAVSQTLQQVTRVTRRGITINTFMLHDSPELVGFVERMTEINRGRALFTDPQKLGSYVLVDHLRRR
jgi:uncharacterized protein with von Willebrand factor type A (vWA) domain